MKTKIEAITNKRRKLWKYAQKQKKDIKNKEIKCISIRLDV